MFDGPRQAAAALDVLNLLAAVQADAEPSSLPLRGPLEVSHMLGLSRCFERVQRRQQPWRQGVALHWPHAPSESWPLPNSPCCRATTNCWKG